MSTAGNLAASIKLYRNISFGNKVSLTKQYIPYIGNRTGNLGHQVHARLIKSDDILKRKYYIKTNKWQGCGLDQIWLKNLSHIDVVEAYAVSNIEQSISTTPTQLEIAGNAPTPIPILISIRVVQMMMIVLRIY